MAASNLEHIADTAIIGAGITGLCVAHSMCTATGDQKSFQLIESANAVGGAIQTTLSDGYLAEHGPNSILVKDKRVAAMLDKVGLNEAKVDNEALAARSEAHKRYIVQDDVPLAMPGTPLAMFKTPLFSLGGKLRIALEPFIGRYKGRERGQGEESFADFVRRRLGRDILESAAGPFVSGIYAGDPENLSVRHAFPRLWQLENRYRSVILGAIAMQSGRNPNSNPNSNRLTPARMLSFRSGMHAMPKAIADSLPTASIQLESKLRSITPNDNGWTLVWTDSSAQQHSGHYQNLVLTTPPHRLASLPLPASVHDALKPIFAIESPPVTSLALGFKREDVAHPLDGFGMLIKQSENSPLLGVLFSSSMFDGRAPEGHVTLTCMMGGTIHPEYAQNDDQTVLDELDKLLGVTGSPTFRHQTCWPQAIPQYSLDYQDKLDAMVSCEQAHPGLHLAGNYRGGISVGDCIVNGLTLGEKLGTKIAGH